MTLVSSTSNFGCTPPSHTPLCVSYMLWIQLIRCWSHTHLLINKQSESDLNLHHSSSFWCSAVHFLCCATQILHLQTLLIYQISLEWSNPLTSRSLLRFPSSTEHSSHLQSLNLSTRNPILPGFQRIQSYLHITSTTPSHHISSLTLSNPRISKPHQAHRFKPIPAEPTFSHHLHPHHPLCSRYPKTKIPINQSTKHNKNFHQPLTR